MVRRIAIVNRGEAAMRLIHAVRELNALGGAQIETVALHTDGERSAMFVRERPTRHTPSAPPWIAPTSIWWSSNVR